MRVCILCASVHVLLVYVCLFGVFQYLNIYLFICWLVCFNTHLFTYVYTICVNNPCLNFIVNLCLKKKKINDNFFFIPSLQERKGKMKKEQHTIMMILFSTTTQRNLAYTRPHHSNR